MKSTFGGLQWVYLIFILLAVADSQICEIPREFELTPVQGHLRSSTLMQIESTYACIFH